MMILASTSYYYYKCVLSPFLSLEMVLRLNSQCQRCWIIFPFCWTQNQNYDVIEIQNLYIFLHVLYAIHLDINEINSLDIYYVYFE